MGGPLCRTVAYRTSITRVARALGSRLSIAVFGVRTPRPVQWPSRITPSLSTAKWGKRRSDSRRRGSLVRESYSQSTALREPHGTAKSSAAVPANPSGALTLSIEPPTPLIPPVPCAKMVPLTRVGAVPL